MFDHLHKGFQEACRQLSGRGSLTQGDIDKTLSALREVLLEADVAAAVIADFLETIRRQALGYGVLRSITPGQMVIKIVHDALVELLGPPAEPLALDRGPPAVWLLVGLQGSGKTTTCGKLATYAIKQGRRVLLASLDRRRPAAQAQLAILAEQVGGDCLAPARAGEDDRATAQRALSQARLQGYDLLILDSAGRQAIAEDLMAELAAITAAVPVDETLLVADATTGQDAVTIGTAFAQSLPLTGVILSRADGDARGGAALTLRSVTGQQLRLLGTGEGMDALEVVHAQRLAGRILGMGDVVTLVEKAAAQDDAEEKSRLERQLRKGRFDLDDFAAQLKKMRAMGGLDAMAALLPAGLRARMDANKPDSATLARQLAIISSMTKSERQKPDIIKARRRQRIAQGSGTSVQEINRLLKQHRQAVDVIKKVGRSASAGLTAKKLEGILGRGAS